MQDTTEPMTPRAMITSAIGLETFAVRGVFHRRRNLGTVRYWWKGEAEASPFLGHLDDQAA